MTKKKAAAKLAKKAAKKAAKSAAKENLSVLPTHGIHPPPCSSDEIEFIDAATGRRMCRKA